MKKTGVFMLLALTAVVAFSGCKKEEKVENDTDQMKYVTLGEYKGIEVPKASEEVTEDELYTKITSVLEEHKDYVDVADRAAEDGDTINISVKAEVDGVADEGFTSDDFSFELGSGVYIMEGFAEHLLGVKAADILDFALTIPASFTDASMIGKEVTFHVTVKSVKEGVIPELTDELVAEISEQSTIDEYKNFLREELKKEKIAENENTQKKIVLTEVIKKATITQYPEGSLEKKVAEINEKYSTYAKLQKITVEEYIQKYYGNSVDTYAEELVKEELVLDAIQKAEKISVSNSEYKEKLPAFAEKYAAMKPEDFESTYGKDSIKQAMLWDKTIDFLVENAVIKEAQ